MWEKNVLINKKAKSKIEIKKKQIRNVMQDNTFIIQLNIYLIKKYLIKKQNGGCSAIFGQLAYFRILLLDMRVVTLIDLH